MSEAMELNKSILVTGSHRSGTTWLGNVLSLAENTRYVQEPFNRETNETLGGYRLSNMYAYAYDEDVSLLRKGFLKHIEPIDSRLILKDPIALFSTPWIQDEFGVKVVCMVRHPAGFVSSLIKWKWEFFFGYFAAQPKLMASFSDQIQTEIGLYAKKRHEPVYQACLLWKIIYGWIMNQSPEKRKWEIVRYEDFAQKPQKQYKKLFKKVGLTWSDAVELEISKMSGDENPKESDDPGFKARSSQAMKDVWKTRLSPEQIEIIKEQTFPVWKKFYSKRDWK